MTEINWSRINDDAKDLFDQKKYDKAVLVISLALSQEHNSIPVEILVNYAKCLYYDRKADKALEIVNVILSEHDAYHELLIDKALYLNAIGRREEASNILKDLNDVNNPDPKVRFNLGWHLLHEKEFEIGFNYLQYGKECRAWGNEYLYIEKGILKPEKKWNGEEVSGRFLYILEGGLGDQIIFLRWVNHLIKNYGFNVTVACDNSLQRLLINSGYRCISHQEIESYDYDYYIPSMSYVAIDRSVVRPSSPTSNVKFPYIETYQDKFIMSQIDKYCKMNEFTGKRIGIKWFGNPEFEHDQMRSLPRDKLLEITSKCGHIFSFQFEENIIGIPNMKDLIRDWMDTYSAVSAMDVVVTSCTSIAHLCGAMNKRCIVLVPMVPYFTWASDDMPWYKSVSIIHQTQYNDWTDAFDQLDKILNKL